MKEVWIVDEDEYNDFSYWSTKEKAIERMKRIILNDEEIDSELFQEHEDYVCYDDWVSAREEVLDLP